MMRLTLRTTLAAMLVLSMPAGADDLTLAIERDLAALGYATGPVDGEETMETVIAISKFQAENEMEVTGEATPQLAGILSAQTSNAAPAPVTPKSSATTSAARTPAELQAAQQACLQEKIAAAEGAKKKKRGLGRLMSAVARTAGQFGSHDLSRKMGDVYSANATAADLSAAAKDLGLTEDEVAACENP